MGLATIVNDDAAISVGGASAVEGGNTLKNLGSFIDNSSGGLSRARSSIIGPDGNMYVASADTNTDTYGHPFTYAASPAHYTNATTTS